MGGKASAQPGKIKPYVCLKVPFFWTVWDVMVSRRRVARIRLPGLLWSIRLTQGEANGK